jgi:hypothetical protein
VDDCPVQGDQGTRDYARRQPGTCSRTDGERAWAAYAEEYGTGQSLDRLCARGGFSRGEMDMYAPGWVDTMPRPKVRFLYQGSLRGSGISAWVPRNSLDDAYRLTEEVAHAIGWGLYLDRPGKIHELRGHRGRGSAEYRSYERADEVEGRGVRFAKGGWTIVNFFDRSGGDSRYGMHSMFALEGDWTIEEVVTHAREVMPPTFWQTRTFTLDIQDV